MKRKEVELCLMYISTKQCNTQNKNVLKTVPTSVEFLDLREYGQIHLLNKNVAKSCAMFWKVGFSLTLPITLLYQLLMESSWK